jgi:hypothetical protein
MSKHQLEFRHRKPIFWYIAALLLGINSVGRPLESVRIGGAFVRSYCGLIGRGDQFVFLTDDVLREGGGVCMKRNIFRGTLRACTVDQIEENDCNRKEDRPNDRRCHRVALVRARS